MSAHRAATSTALRAWRNAARPGTLRSISRASSSSSSSSSAGAKAGRTAASAALVASAAAVAAVTTLYVQSRPLACDAPSTKASSGLGQASLPSIPTIDHLNPAVIHDPSAPMRDRMETYIKLLQHRIVSALQKTEPGTSFIVDSWKRKEGGEGISCIVQDGETFEKAGCNISVVHGKLPLGAIKQMNSGRINARLDYRFDGPDAEIDSMPFVALGLSLVVHPVNPFAPTVHFNYRYFEIAHPPTLKDGSPNPRYDPSNPTLPAAWWFGGGTDLTPIYLFEEDAKHFHTTLRDAAAKHDEAFYPAWKRWCDEYFWLPHRDENRGIGGVFFDDLTVPGTWGQAEAKRKGRQEFLALLETKQQQKGAPAIASSSRQHDVESLFATVRSMGDSFLPSYLPLLERRRHMPYDARHVAWQGIRRGRYVEFNLAYDRGTKFGLATPGARIESILMSLPLKARWEYMHPVSGTGKMGQGGASAPGEDNSDGRGLTEEEKMQRVLRSPREWV